MMYIYSFVIVDPKQEYLSCINLYCPCSQVMNEWGFLNKYMYAHYSVMS